ncbi:hypothetical protein [Acidihalobacter prosperus]
MGMSDTTKISLAFGIFVGVVVGVMVLTIGGIMVHPKPTPGWLVLASLAIGLVTGLFSGYKFTGFSPEDDDNSKKDGR